MSASNSWRSKSGSAQMMSANSVPASRVARSMPITSREPAVALPRSMTDTLFI